MTTNKMQYATFDYDQSDRSMRCFSSEYTDSSSGSISEASILDLPKWQHHWERYERVLSELTVIEFDLINAVLSRESDGTQSTKTSPEMIEFPWLRDIYHNGRLKSAAHELYPLIEHIDVIVDSENLEKLDRVLEGIELAKISPALMGALIRVTFPMRASLSRWSKTLERINNELVLRGERPDKWLRGLK